MGLSLTGATAAGPVWAEYMDLVHQDLPADPFPEPLDGVVRVTVSATSGLLPRPGVDEETVEEVFIEGTEPRQFSDLAQREKQIRERGIENLGGTLIEASFPLPDTVFDVDLFGGSDQGTPVSDSSNPLLD